MSVSVLSGMSQPLKATGQSISGIAIPLFLQKLAVNAAITTADYDLKQITIDVKLNRRGVVTTIMSEPLAVSLLRGGESLSNNVALMTNPNQSLQVQTVSLPHQVLLPFMIDFGGVINLSGSDELTAIITLNGTSFAATLNTTASFLEAEFIQGVGLEFVTPRLLYQTITAGQSNPTIDLGSNVTEVSIVTLSKLTSILSADRVVSSIMLDSDRVNMLCTYNQLLSKRFNDVNDMRTLGQLFCIYKGGEIDEAKLILTLNAVNVISNDTFIIYSSFDTDVNLVRKASFKSEKHDAQLAQKIQNK